MSTNFYKIIPLSKTDESILKARIKNKEYTVDEEGNITFNDEYQFPSTKIHIGKRSGGWKFVFYANNWRYFNSEESLLEWLKYDKDESYIIDEYGDRYSYEEFIKEVNDTYTDTAIDLNDYYKKNPKAFISSKQLEDEIYMGKYRVCLTWFR